MNAVLINNILVVVSGSILLIVGSSLANAALISWFKPSAVQLRAQAENDRKQAEGNNQANAKKAVNWAMWLPLAMFGLAALAMLGGIVALLLFAWCAKAS